MNELFYPHKIFLKWLLFITFVMGIFITSTFVEYNGLNLPFLIWKFDITYLSAIVFGLYLFSEMMNAKNIFKLSKEINLAKKLLTFLKNNDNTSYVLINNKIIVKNDLNEFILDNNNSYIHDHIKSLLMRASGKRINQQVLIEKLKDNLKEKYASTLEFIGETIINLGVLGTIIGVILTILPFYELQSFTFQTMQPLMGKLFVGLAVAFFPTALAIAFKAFLDFSGKLLISAISDLTDSITIISENYILPNIERK